MESSDLIFAKEGITSPTSNIPALQKHTYTTTRNPTALGMGLPYSKQITAAFEQVNPLVASGYETLQTIKRIAFILAFIQILTVVLLSAILLSLFGLLITLNPSLQEERDVIVTPCVRALADLALWIITVGSTMFLWIIGSILFGCGVGVAWATWYTKHDLTLIVDEPEDKVAEE